MLSIGNDGPLGSTQPANDACCVNNGSSRQQKHDLKPGDGSVQGSAKRDSNDARAENKPSDFAQAARPRRSIAIGAAGAAVVVAI